MGRKFDAGTSRKPLEWEELRLLKTVSFRVAESDRDESDDDVDVLDIVGTSACLCMQNGVLSFCADEEYTRRKKVHDVMLLKSGVECQAAQLRSTSQVSAKRCKVWRRVSVLLVIGVLVHPSTRDRKRNMGVLPSIVASPWALFSAVHSRIPVRFLGQGV